MLKASGGTGLAPKTHRAMQIALIWHFSPLMPKTIRFKSDLGLAALSRIA